jgi:hypothetical protein
MKKKDAAILRKFYKEWDDRWKLHRELQVELATMKLQDEVYRIERMYHRRLNEAEGAAVWKTLSKAPQLRVWDALRIYKAKLALKK